MLEFTFDMIDTSYKVIIGGFIIVMVLHAIIVSIAIPIYIRGKNRTMPNLNTSLFNYMVVYLVLLVHYFMQMLITKAYNQVYDKDVYTLESIKYMDMLYTGVRVGTGVLTGYVIIGFIFYGGIYFYNKQKGITLEVHKERVARRKTGGRRNVSGNE